MAKAKPPGSSQAHSSAQAPTTPPFPWGELVKWATVIPVAGAVFAFSFDIGYFYSFDIGWFTFFSLPEHTAFAIRALPIAIAALIVVGLIMNPEHIMQAAGRKLYVLKNALERKTCCTRLDVVFERIVICVFVVTIIFILAMQIYYLWTDNDPYFRRLLVRYIGFGASWLVAMPIIYVSYHIFPKKKHRIPKVLWVVTLLTAASYVLWIEGYMTLSMSIVSLVAGTIVYFTTTNERPEIKFAYLFLVVTVATFF
jgi:hypothetical protein